MAISTRVGGKVETKPKDREKPVSGSTFFLLLRPSPHNGRHSLTITAKKRQDVPLTRRESRNIIYMSLGVTQKE